MPKKSKKEPTVITDVKIGDLVSIPLLESKNQFNYFMLADDLIEKIKTEVVCEIAHINKDVAANQHMYLLFVPKIAGWPWDSGLLTDDKLNSNLSITKKSQHNGWWISHKLLVKRAEGTW